MLLGRGLWWGFFVVENGECCCVGEGSVLNVLGEYGGCSGVCWRGVWEVFSVRMLCGITLGKGLECLLVF